MNVKTGTSYGRVCENCGGSPFHEWTIYETGRPRVGDGEYECKACKTRTPMYSNRETIRDIRAKEAETSKTTRDYCQRCKGVQLMNTEAGTETWPIAECVECGQRYDW
jgi:hypothetical protein